MGVQRSVFATKFEGMQGQGRNRRNRRTVVSVFDANNTSNWLYLYRASPASLLLSRGRTLCRTHLVIAVVSAGNFGRSLCRTQL